MRNLWKEFKWQKQDKEWKVLILERLGKEVKREVVGKELYVTKKIFWIGKYAIYAYLNYAMPTFEFFNCHIDKDYKLILSEHAKLAQQK